MVSAAHSSIPRTGALTDFLFVAHGRRLSQTRLRNGLLTGTPSCGLRGTGGAQLVVTPHQLRHTWAHRTRQRRDEPASVDGTPRGHATGTDDYRYAILASPTLRDAYDAMGKMRRRFTLTPVGNPIVPNTVSWLGSAMLKTRVAHGYCSRQQAAGGCPYVNICETCDNFVTGPEFHGALGGATHRHPGPRGRRPRPWLARRSRPPPPRHRRPNRPPPPPRPLTRVDNQGLIRPQGPDNRETEQGDPAPYRRGRDLPESGRDRAPGRCGAGRTDRRMT